MSFISNSLSGISSFVSKGGEIARQASDHSSTIARIGLGLAATSAVLDIVRKKGEIIQAVINKKGLQMVAKIDRAAAAFGKLKAKPA